MTTKRHGETACERVELALLPPLWPELTPERAEQWLREGCERFAELIVVGLEDEALTVEPKRTRAALSLLAIDLDEMRRACARVAKTRQAAPLGRTSGDPSHLEDLALLLAVDNPAYDLAGARSALAHELVLRLRGGQGDA